MHIFCVSLNVKQDALTWNGVRLGPIDNSKLKYWCEKAGSDFYELWENDVKNLAGLQSDWLAAKIVDFASLLRHQTSKAKEIRLRVLVIEYFEAVSEIYLDEMWDGVFEKNSIYDAIGINCFDANSFRKALPIRRISIYNWQSETGKTGWVVPLGTEINFNWNTEDSVRVKRSRQFEKEYTLDDFGDSEIHQMIRLYARTLAEASRSANASNFSDALLKCFTAIELVFAEKSGIAGSVAKRIAVVLNPTDGRAQDRSEKNILKFYDLRSKYVHRGTKVIADQAEQVRTIAKKILLCLLELQKDPRNCEDKFFNTWKSRIDLIYLSHKSGYPPTTEQLRDAGLSDQNQLDWLD